MWFGFQFNLSDSADDDLYRLDFNLPVENDLYIAGIIFWCTPKKLRRGCLRVRLDANANTDANCSKTKCRTPLRRLT